ncbi:hypothetical protein [Microbulbifer sp. TYP-18]|uniref:hypothetical protein n=1 Tax=Microbulbifer sp. TYP-18 TaxID=3230024 RepID=UPI0034C6A441
MEQAGQSQYQEVAVSNKFAASTRRPLYGKFSIVLLGVILISLIPHYSQIASSSSRVPIELIVHGVLYLGWYILFCFQIHLISSGKRSVHRKLGYASIFFFVLLIISGIEMMVGIMGSQDPVKQSLFWGVLHTVIFFAAFYILGVFSRGNLHAHKRFMLLASLSMISASITRVAYYPIIPIDGTAVTILCTYGLLLVPLIIDRFKFGRVHPVLKFSIPIYIVTQIAFIAILPSTEVGRAIFFPS